MHFNYTFCRSCAFRLASIDLTFLLQRGKFITGYFSVSYVYCYVLVYNAVWSYGWLQTFLEKLFNFQCRWRWKLLILPKRWENIYKTTLYHSSEDQSQSFSGIEKLKYENLILFNGDKGFNTVVHGLFGIWIQYLLN